VTAPTPLPPAGSPVADVLAARLRAGRLAEYGHLLHDADPDSTVPAFPDLSKGVRLEVARCWCGHPRDRHWASESMTFGAGCHDCPGWDGAHAYGRELPWVPEAGEPR
jgi:hypothetical protein